MSIEIFGVPAGEFVGSTKYGALALTSIEIAVFLPLPSGATL
jgi:hypothetical protein